MVTIKTKRLIIREEIFEDSCGIQKLVKEPEGWIFTVSVKNITIEEIKKKLRRTKIYSQQILKK